MKQRRFIYRVSAAAALVAVTAMAQSKAAKSSGATWSGAVTISPVLSPDPTRGSQLNDIAVTPNGLALAAWDQFSYTSGTPTVIGAAIQAAGKWGAPFVLSGNATGFATTPRVAAGADGTLAASWIYQDAGALVESIQAAVRRPGAAAFSVTTLAQRPARGTIEAAPIGVDSFGNVTVVWTAPSGSSIVVQAATMQGNLWSPPATISGSTTGTLYPSLSVNANGDAGVIYSVWPADYTNLRTYAEYVFRPGLSGAWTAPATVSEVLSASVGYVQNLMVALDGQGLATIAYTSTGVRANRQSPSRQWGTPQTVLLPGGPRPRRRVRHLRRRDLEIFKERHPNPVGHVSLTRLVQPTLTAALVRSRSGATPSRSCRCPA